MNIFVLLLFVPLLLLLFITISAPSLALNLDPLENATLGFIAYQYGTTLTITKQSVCGDSLTNACDTDNDQFTHIKSLNVTVDQYKAPNTIPSNITSLYFSKLKSFTLRAANQVTNPSINLLNLMNNISQLMDLEVANDPSITSIPSTFTSGLPKLKSITIKSCSNLTSIPSFFPAGSSHNLSRLSIRQCPLDSLVINTSTSLNKVKTLELDIVGNTLNTLTFTASSFKELQTLSLSSNGTLEQIVNLDSSLTSLLEIDLNARGTGGFKLLPNGALPNIQSITLTGNSSIESFFPNYYTQLITLNYLSTQATTYPWGSSSFPNILQTLSFSGSKFSVIPTTPIPLSIINLDFSNNVLTSIPWSNAFGTRLAPVPNQHLYLNLDLSGNVDLNTVIPDAMCNNTGLLNIRDTKIDLVPDCFSCYLDPTYFQADSNVGQDQSNCNIVLDSPLLILNNKEGFITGSLLGYGVNQDEYNTSFIIPHQHLRITWKYLINGPITSKLILFSNLYQVLSRSIQVVEAGIKVNSYRISKYAGDIVKFKFKMDNMNPGINHIVVINNSINCYIVSMNVNSLECQTNVPLPSSQLNFNISNQYRFVTGNINYNSSYPYITSADFKNDTNQISLSGYFGSTLSSLIVQIEQSSTSIPCLIDSSNSTFITCVMNGQPNYGLANINMQVDDLEYSSTSALYFQDKSKRSKEECQVKNCYKRGYCDNNGQCICDNSIYNPLDDCLTKFTSNVTQIVDPSKPTSSFDINDVQFQFDIVAIQELDMDDTLLQELITKDWNSTITTATDTTSAVYQLYHSNYSNTNLPNITSFISFSSQARDIEFGEQLLHIPPNSIKLTLSIKNWSYKSTLSTLRVLFSVNIPKDQIVDVGCDNQQEINILQYDNSSSTIQYLRVVKGNVQFSGRFLDFVLSDGRSTFSKTSVINQTSIDNEQLNTLIGVTLPQCQECVLDPDFTPLIIDKQSDCGGTQSGTWRIIVGVVVGVAVVAAIVTGVLLWRRKQQLSSRQKKSFDSKLKEYQ